VPARQRRSLAAILFAGPAIEAQIAARANPGGLVATVLRSAKSGASAAASSAAKTEGRIILDVSSLVRWVGTPIGILRVEHALATYARASRPDIVLAVYDPAIPAFRQVSPDWAGTVLGWDGAIDALTFDHRRHWPLLRRWLSPRYPLLMALERRRLTAGSARLRHFTGCLQQVLWLGRPLPAPFTGHDHRRIAVVSADHALGQPLVPGPQDTVVTAGYDWVNQSPARIDAGRRHHGFRYVAMCHDIIALQFPDLLPDHAVAAFRSYWPAMLSAADRILVNSRQVELDIRAYCASAAIPPADIRRVTLGFDPPRSQPPAILPAGLEPQRFILFVSTIEPRKGHAELLRFWERLLAAGVPQRLRFKLVLIGRGGWNVEALLRRIDEPAAFEGCLLHLEDIDDAQLSALYDDAAFCVHPSRYEGFGLPILEAFAHGKAVIASTSGALPETVDGFSPCLDLADEEAWFAMLRRWIEEPAARAPYEAKIRDSFAGPDWDQAAARIFEAALAP
jgi:glycosyltransferase involved in cell wall biosynthesis